MRLYPNDVFVSHPLGTPGIPYPEIDRILFPSTSTSISTDSSPPSRSHSRSHPPPPRADATENNKDSPPGTIDLHGLYVKEAIERTEAAINQAQGKGQDEMRVIVGKGLHSQGNVARIKPAVEDLMRR